MGPKDLGNVDWNTASESLDESGVWPSSVSGKCVGSAGEKGLRTILGECWAPDPWGPRWVGMVDPRGTLPLYPFRFLPFRFGRHLSRPPPSLSVQLPPLGSCFGETCVKQVAPADTQGMHENSTYDELHLLRTKRGYAQTDSKAALKAPLNTVAAVLHGRARDVVDAMEPRPSLSTYKRNVAPFGLRFG